MQIFVLVENIAGAQTPTEHGLSYLIECDGKSIIFDTGQSDLFVNNAAAMGFSLDRIDFIVLSHGHYDHGNGLEYLRGGELICHPGCFVKRFRKTDNTYIGLKSTQEELDARFSVTLSSTPVNLSKGIVFLGEIPRVTTFESKSTSFVFEDGSPDFVADDTALAMILPEGLFVVTGCGHSGIVNTLEYAIKVTGIDKIFGVMGGFHLKENDLQTRETISYLQRKKVKHVLPSHCTSGAALVEFQRLFGTRTIKTGDILEF